MQGMVRDCYRVADAQGDIEDMLIPKKSPILFEIFEKNIEKKVEELREKGVTPRRLIVHPITYREIILRDHPLDNDWAGPVGFEVKEYFAGLKTSAYPDIEVDEYRLEVEI